MKKLLLLLCLLPMLASAQIASDTKVLQDLINIRGVATQINVAQDSFIVGDIYIPSGVMLVGLKKPYIKAHSINFIGAVNSGIKGFIIEGALAAAPASTAIVQILGSAYIDVSDNEIKNNMAEGVSIRNSNNFRVVANSFFNTDCAIITHGGCFSGLIKDNKSDGKRSDCIAIFGKVFRNGVDIHDELILSTDQIIKDYNITVEHNFLKNKPGGNGIVVRCAENIRIKDNEIDSCNFGIGAMQGVSFCTISNNTVANADRGITGLWQNSTISLNQVSLCNNAIWIGPTAITDTLFNSVISTNIFKNCTAGAFFTNAKNCIIQNNTMSDDRPFADYGYGGVSQPTYAGFIVKNGIDNKIVGNTGVCAFRPVHIDFAKNTLVYANVGRITDQGLNTLQPEKQIEIMTKKLTDLQLKYDAAFPKPPTP